MLWPVCVWEGGRGRWRRQQQVPSSVVLLLLRRPLGRWLRRVLLVGPRRLRGRRLCVSGRGVGSGWRLRHHSRCRRPAAIRLRRWLPVRRGVLLRRRDGCADGGRSARRRHVQRRQRTWRIVLRRWRRHIRPAAAGTFHCHRGILDWYGDEVRALARARHVGAVRGLGATPWQSRAVVLAAYGDRRGCRPNTYSKLLLHYKRWLLNRARHMSVIDMRLQHSTTPYILITSPSSITFFHAFL